MRSKRIGQQISADEFFGEKRLVPFEEIGYRRINTAVAQNRAGDILVAKFPAVFSIGITISPVRHGGESLGIDNRIRHVYRIENLFLQERRKRFSGNSFNH